MDDVPAASLSLRSTSLSIIRQWLTDKLSTSAWVALIEKIKLMAEGGEHSHVHVPERGHILASMGLDPRSLHTAGVPPALVHRVYKALWVYSEGMHELIIQVAHHCRGNRQVVASIWKCFAILLEDYAGEDYVMALLQVENESQRVLKDMEERFSKSMQVKQDHEVKSATHTHTNMLIMPARPHHFAHHSAVVCLVVVCLCVQNSIRGEDFVCVVGSQSD